MENLCELFRKISATSSTKEKKSLLASFQDKERLKKVLLFAYDPDVLFRITSDVIKPALINVKFGNFDDIPVEAFSKLLQTQGTNAKLKYVLEISSQLTANATQWFLNVIDKDISIGMKKKLINAVFPGLIKEFLVMLAERRNKENYLRIFNTETVYLNLKIDGIRCVCDFTGTEPAFYTREGHRVPDFLTENIKADIVSMADKYRGKIFDGEIYCNNFQRLMTVFRREKIDAEAIAVRNSCKYAIFDIIVQNIPLRSRLVMLDAIPETPIVKKVKYVCVKNDYDLICRVAQKYIERGDEGIIVKHPESLYEGKRSLNWMKFKNKETEDCKIIKYYSGEGKYLDKLGGFVVDFGGKELSVGSGYTDAERKEFWENRDSYIGKIMEISFMEKTKDELARHPVFERMRLDRGAE